MYIYIYIYIHTTDLHVVPGSQPSPASVPDVFELTPYSKSHLVEDVYGRDASKNSPATEGATSANARNSPGKNLRTKHSPGRALAAAADAAVRDVVHETRSERNAAATDVAQSKSSDSEDSMQESIIHVDQTVLEKLETSSSKSPTASSPTGPVVNSELSEGKRGSNPGSAVRGRGVDSTPFGSRQSPWQLASHTVQLNR
jgi:hypothetical protein